jgi:predicted permease
MLTIWGIVLLTVGVLLGVFLPHLLPRIGKGLATIYLGTALVVLGAGLQIYAAWGKLPPQCRTVLAMNCETPTPVSSKSKRR